jgi:hypothetical protein
MGDGSYIFEDQGLILVRGGKYRLTLGLNPSNGG